MNVWIIVIALSLSGCYRESLNYGLEKPVWETLSQTEKDAVKEGYLRCQEIKNEERVYNVPVSIWNDMPPEEKQAVMRGESKITNLQRSLQPLRDRADQLEASNDDLKDDIKEYKNKIRKLETTKRSRNKRSHKKRRKKKHSSRTKRQIVIPLINNDPAVDLEPF